MKFRAQVTFKGEKNVQHLIRAFFVNFNPESSIMIKGNDAKMEVVFDTPPMEIIDAIGYCEVIEFEYGKTEVPMQPAQEVVKEEVPMEAAQEIVKEEVLIQPAQNVVEEKQPIQPKLMEKENESSKNSGQVGRKNSTTKNSKTSKKKTAELVTQKEKQTKEVSEKIINLPELEEIAKKATSFENFVKLVAEWLEMDRRQEFFKNLAIAASETEKVSWKCIESVLKDKKVFYTQWDKTWASLQVSEKLKEQSVTMLNLLNEIKRYKNYSFENEEEQIVEENNSKQPEEEEISKPRLKMECMPEIKEFEEKLAAVDKTQPIEDRVRYVLTSMGLKKKDRSEQKEIFEITNTAVRLGRIAWDIIFLKANIPMESSMNARMTLSKFINDFVKGYVPDAKVAVLDFLKSLQKIVMFENEIESYADFVEQ